MFYLLLNFSSIIVSNPISCLLLVIISSQRKKMRLSPQKKPGDRIDSEGVRVTRIMLVDYSERKVEAKYGDIVQVRNTTSGKSDNKEGILVGFTEQRTQVYLNHKLRHFSDRNLEFVRPGEEKESMNEEKQSS